MKVAVGLLLVLLTTVSAGCATTRAPRFGAGGASSAASPADSFTAPQLDGVENFRTVCLPGKMKPGVLFRSARLAGATAGDTEKLAALLHGGLVIDLRTVGERSQSPDPPISGVLDKNFPVQGVGSAGGYVSAFVDSADGRARFGAAITALANAGGGVLVHCTFGKDRTGWFTAMVMYTLGASDRQVMDEYLRSNGQIPGASVDAAWLNAALSDAIKRYGSIADYIRSGLGVSDATTERLRARFGA